MGQNYIIDQYNSQIVCLCLLITWISHLEVSCYVIADLKTQFETRLLIKFNHLVRFHHLRTASCKLETNDYMKCMQRTNKTL